MSDDLDLVRRMLKGDERAFDTFFEAHFPSLYRFALARMEDDPGAAEDAVQSALSKAVTKLGTFRGEASLFTWLCTFCRHEIAAYYERSRRQPPTLALVEDRDDVRAAIESLSASRLDEPEARLERSEVVRLVHVALDRLPSRYGDVLEWKYVQDLSVAEIAGRLGLSPKAAESMLTRARMAFGEVFAALAGATPKRSPR